MHAVTQGMRLDLSAWNMWAGLNQQLDCPFGQNVRLLALQYSVSTRAYKAPELLLHYTSYNYGIDMWGVGMHLASFVFKKKQIFDCE